MRATFERRLARLPSTSLQVLPAASFSLVTAVTIGISAMATSRAIGNYLSEATNERVARDMTLAQASYDIKLRGIPGIANLRSLPRSSETTWTRQAGPASKSWRTNQDGGSQGCGIAVAQQRGDHD